MKSHQLFSDVKGPSIIHSLRTHTQNFTPTLSESIIAEYGNNPFLVLISCLLSLRAKDSMTIHVCRELFDQARTPREILDLPQKHLEKILYRIGFYQNKARTLRSVCHDLLKRFEGKVPETMSDLLSIKGVGRKTANLVLGLAFNIPGICVDIHVHRIANRLGWVQTKTPEQTEAALKKLVPQEYWIELNRLLVMWGQNVCTPISPFCSRCAIRPYCQRVGVTSSR